MGDRIVVYPAGRYCKVEMKSMEMKAEISLTDEELFIFAVNCASVAAERIRGKDYRNNKNLDVLKEALKKAQ